LIDIIFLPDFHLENPFFGNKNREHFLMNGLEKCSLMQNSVFHGTVLKKCENAGMRECRNGKIQGKNMSIEFRLQPPRLPARTSRKSTPPGQEEKFELKQILNFKSKAHYKFPLHFFQGGVAESMKK
jgi:hypothetical protein